MLETDVRVTADGVLLAFHDATLDRTTGVSGKVSDFTFDQLRSLRVGGEPLLRLDVLLAAFPDTEFLIDIKEARAVQPTIDALRLTHSADRVIVAGGWDTWLQDIASTVGARHALGWRGLTALMTGARLGRRISPQVRSRFVANAVSAHVARKLCGVQWMSHPAFRERLVEMAHELGLRVHAWTINDPDEMNAMIDAGVDTFITDYPDIGREVAIRRGVWPHPNATPASGLAVSHTVSPASNASAAAERSATASSVRFVSPSRAHA